VHLAAFPGFFLSRLGAGFLRQLYRTFVCDPDGVCVVAERQMESGGEEIVGFIAGTTAPASLFRRALVNRGVLFALAATGALVRHPVLVGKRLIAAIWYRGDSPPHQPSAALLSSLAVVPSVRQLGIGRTLVAAFCAATRQAKLRYVYLTTDQEDNEAVNRFYHSLGFEVSATTTRGDGRTMNTFLKSV
jgi:ribosomal protein S18 acetylase RimI-like enzyme